MGGGGECKLMLFLFSLGLCQYVYLQVPNHQSNIIKRPLGMFVYELEEVCTSVVVYQYVYQHFSLCLYFIEWILTQGLTPTNQNSLNLPSLHSLQSILTSFLPSYLLFTGGMATLSIAWLFSFFPSISLSHEEGSSLHASSSAICLHIVWALWTMFKHVSIYKYD